MKAYTVDLTLTYNGTMRIEAENPDEALRIAQENLNSETLKEFPDTVEMPNDGCFTFGEATADYAYTEENNNNITEQDKQLLLKDLYSRLPYGVI